MRPALRLLALLASAAAWAAQPTVEVTFDEAHPGTRLPADFGGISYEKNALIEPHFRPSNQALVNLHRNLGAGTLRLGGNKVELTRWQPAAGASLDKATGLAVIGRATLDDLYGFLRATGWRSIHGVNLSGGRPEESADEAAYARQIGGDALLAVEVGNEPNLYAGHDLRPKDYGSAAYVPEAKTAIRVLRAKVPGIVLAAPANARRTDHWFEDAVAGLKGDLEVATSHTYALSGGSTNPKSANFPSIPNLLAAATLAKDLTMVDEHVAAARKAGMRYRLAECNTVSNGGRAGVSDTFASALWAADFLFGVAEHGADGLNFHCNLKAGSYSPIVWKKDAGAYLAQPIYYGMLAFRAAGQGRLLPAKASGSTAVTAHATLGDDGKVRVLLTNKDLGQAVAVRLPAARAKGSIQRLSAPAVDAQAGVSFAGAAVGADGRWSPSNSEPLTSSGAGPTVTLPAASAAVVTLD